MDKEQLVAELVTRFEDKRANFLSDVRSAVAGYISQQGSGCLTLVERRSSGDATWALSANPQYVARLVPFCRGATYDGHVIDSALTEPVVGIVTRQFEMLYQSNDEDISRAIVAYILEDKVMSNALVEAVVGSALVGHAASAVKQKVAALILDQLREILQTGSAKTVMATVGKSVAAMAAKPVGAKIAALLMKFIALNMKAIIAKVLASAALKGMIAGAVKKFLIVAIGAAVVKAIAAKFGISAAAVWLWFLLPLIAAFLIYEIATFPQHLAEKVSDRVAEDLRGSFTKINGDVFDRIVSEVLAVGVGAIAADLGRSKEVQDAISELIAEFA